MSDGWPSMMGNRAEIVCHSARKSGEGAGCANARTIQTLGAPGFKRNGISNARLSQADTFSRLTPSRGGRWSDMLTVSQAPAETYRSASWLVPPVQFRACRSRALRSDRSRLRSAQSLRRQRRVLRSRAATRAVAMRHRAIQTRADAPRQAVATVASRIGSTLTSSWLARSGQMTDRRLTSENGLVFLFFAKSFLNSKQASPASIRKRNRLRSKGLPTGSALMVELWRRKAREEAGGGC